MGFFFTNYKPRGNVITFKEAEIEGQDVEQEETPDYTQEDQNQEAQTNPEPENDGDESPDYTEEDQTQNTDEDQQQDGDEQPVEDEQTPDYTEEDQAQNPEEDGGEATTQDQPESPTEIDELKRQEEEIYKDLSPEQLDIKHKELKNRCLEMFDITTTIIDRIGDISIAEENIETMQYISNSLSSLRDMLTDYINSVYKTKSYIENTINYNKFLAILNGINEILEEMNSKENN